ncbi:MAG: hypothetical protein Q9161_007159 [Pseudevernia consocians]
MSDPVCEIGLAATEVVINKGEEPEEPEELEEPEEPEEPKDKVPNNPRENEIAVEPCDPVGLDVESVAVGAMDAVPVKAGLLLEGRLAELPCVNPLDAVAADTGVPPVETPPPDVAPESKPLDRLLVPAPTPTIVAPEFGVPKKLDEIPCVEPLAVTIPAVAALEPEIPEILAELPDAVPKLDVGIPPIEETEDTTKLDAEFDPGAPAIDV